MKTTNYEISKKLWEIGFIAKFDDRFMYPIKPEEIQGNHAKYGFKYPSYFLETILEALPKKLQFHGEEPKDLKTWFLGVKTIFQKWQIMYMDCECKSVELTVAKQDDESLADTAARLLILLESKNLVKFK